MAIQLAQLSNIAEDHLEETQDAYKFDIKDLFKYEDAGIIGGRFKKDKWGWTRFILQISLDDGTIVSETIPDDKHDYDDQIKKIKKRNKTQKTTGEAVSQSTSIGFKLQSSFTQLGMGFAVVIGIALFAGLYPIKSSPVLVLLNYLGIALLGYFDLKLVQQYDVWNPIGFAWLIILLFPGLNTAGAIGYMGRRWSVIYGDN